MKIDASEPPRNLQSGWCPRGESLSIALGHLDTHVLDGIQFEFRNTDGSEWRAAFLLHAFTGLVPRLEDDLRVLGRARNGAVDIALEGLAGETQIAEVTTSLDPNYQSSSAALSKFELAVARQYRGSASWILHLENGWDRAQLIKELAPAVAHALVALDLSEEDGPGPRAIHPLVKASLLASTSPPVVRVVTRNAAASAVDEPYLDALTRYLGTDPTIQGKLTKLTREAVVYRATRCHLFVGMASTGTRGGLLPASPSYFTWGTFAAPAPLTDLWMEGGTGELYHWTSAEGWVFHDLQA